MAGAGLRKLAAVCGVLVALALANAPAAPAQDATAPTDEVQIVSTVTDRYPEIELVVALPPVLAGQELEGSAFALIENGLQRAVEVEPSRDPLQVVMVIDTSGSMGGDPLTAATDAAIDFVDRLPADAELAVVGFGEQTSVAARFDNSSAEVITAISSLEAEGETALYDAVVAASQLFADASTTATSSAGVQRFVILLSDGRDTASEQTLAQARDALLDVGAYLYAVTLDSEDADFAGLEQLTSEVSGRILSARATNELAAVYAELATRLTSRYRVHYTTTATAGADLSLSVRSGDVLGTAVQTIDVSGVTGVGVETPTPTTASGTLVVSEPEVIRPPEPGFLASKTALYLGAGVFFVFAAGVLAYLFGRERDRRSARPKLQLRNTRRVRRGGLQGVMGAASIVADKALAKRKQGRDLDAALDRAGIEMRPGEFVTAAAGVALLAGLLGLVFVGTLGMAIFPLVAIFLSRFYLKFKAGRRRKKFELQLGDTLVILSGGLRAGHGIMQALDSVAMQAEAPTGEEISRVLAETRIGRDVIDSLEDVAERTGSEDFIWVVRAIAINRELGGDLAEILDNVGETIRERSRLKDQV
ncbi:MAG: VWA domain-containing protein, partial [Acidimicrobiales bacterium]|nr:VWA domain-containing protein [Acidimicrobiales bacterium]